jgi:hypothetical protein
VEVGISTRYWRKLGINDDLGLLCFGFGERCFRTNCPKSEVNITFFCIYDSYNFIFLNLSHHSNFQFSVSSSKYLSNRIRSRAVLDCFIFSNHFFCIGI